MKDKRSEEASTAPNATEEVAATIAAPRSTSKISRYWALGVLILTLAVFTMSIKTLLDVLGTKRLIDGRLGMATLFENFESWQKRHDVTLAELSGAVDTIRRQFDALEASRSEVASEVELARVSVLAESIDERLSRLEEAILADPEKALALPLLRNDLNSLSASYESEFNNLRMAVAGASEFANKIFMLLFGAIIAMVLGAAKSWFTQRGVSSAA